MNLDVDFVSVMSTLGLSLKQKAGNYQCPFCTKKSFTVYPENQMGYCHTCKWSGDGLKLYREWKKVSRDEAFQELAVALGDGSLRLKEKGSEFKEQTYAEAKKEFAKDLEFLAWVRMYEGFIADKAERWDRNVLIRKCGLEKAIISQILNGKKDKVLNGICNPGTWRKVLAVLRSDLEKPIEKLKKDLSLGTQYFENQIDEEQRGKDVEKFRIKKQRRPRAKIDEKE